MARTIQIRGIENTVRGMETFDGAGVRLKRILGSPELNMLDPFLLLDEFKNDDPQDYAAGFPDHPHRGIETVTYLLAGAFTHRDSKGHEGHLNAGSVQWMTAGRGIIHSEMPEQREGLSWGYQLWLNLPAKFKMIEPRYQDIPSENLPILQKNGARVKVIAGEYDGARSPAQCRYPVSYFDVQLEPGADFNHPVPPDQNAFIYVIKDGIQTGPDNFLAHVQEGHLGVFGKGESVRLQSADKSPARFLFASGQRLNESVARGGPFVMNTPVEIKQAFADYQAGRLG